MTCEPLIDILLPTYNAKKFLPELLDSILMQSYNNIRIIISDDHSEDSTPDIIAAYAKRDARIKIVKHEKHFGTAQASYLFLLTQSNAPYCMFCDHDDVWLPEKIGDLLACIRYTEDKAGFNTPLLVCSDAVVVDSDLKTIAVSHERYANMPHTKKDLSLSRVIVQNPAVGCTCLFNAALRDLVRSKKVDARHIVMHDWLLSIMASANDGLIYMPKALTLYRQSPSNSIGARKSTEITTDTVHRADVQFGKSFEQAAYIADIYKSELPSHAIKLLTSYAELPELNPLCRVGRCVRRSFWKKGLLRKAGQLLLLLGKLGSKNE